MSSYLYRCKILHECKVTNYRCIIQIFNIYISILVCHFAPIGMTVFDGNQEIIPFLHFLSPKNASEIQALYSHQIGMQGVDSHKETYEVQETSQENAQQESTEIEQAAVSE